MPNFDYHLAEKLGMLVADLRERMSNDEYVRWQIFYARRAQRAELARLTQGR